MDKVGGASMRVQQLVKSGMGVWVGICGACIISGAGHRSVSIKLESTEYFWSVNSPQHHIIVEEFDSGSLGEGFQPATEQEAPGFLFCC
jgi:hypothetical protein